MERKNSIQTSDQKREFLKICGLWLCLLSVVCGLILAGCAQRVVKEVREAEEVVLPPETEVEPVPEEEILALKGEDIPLAELKEIKEAPSIRELTEEEKRIFKNIYFDFDKSDIKPEARPILEEIASYLLKNPTLNLLIEGHCDERGTEEYNLALGERRALSARRYLVGLGVASKRLHTISYGEERPVDPRHNEEAWAKNRRAEFKILEL